MPRHECLEVLADLRGRPHVSESTSAPALTVRTMSSGVCDGMPHTNNRLHGSTGAADGTSSASSSRGAPHEKHASLRAKFDARHCPRIVSAAKRARALANLAADPIEALAWRPRSATSRRRQAKLDLGTPPLDTNGTPCRVEELARGIYRRELHVRKPPR